MLSVRSVPTSRWVMDSQDEEEEERQGESHWEGPVMKQEELRKLREGG